MSFPVHPHNCNCHQLRGLGNLTLTADDRPTSEWSCYDWMYWHKRLVERHGRERANEISQREWDNQSWWTHTRKLDWCKYNPDWVAYYDKQGVDAGNFVSDTQAIVDNVFGTAKGVTKATQNTANTLKWALPVAILVVGGGVIWYLAQSRKMVTEAAISRFKK